MESLIILFIMVVIVGGIGVSVYQEKRTEEAWTEVADRTGLTKSGGGFFSKHRLDGVYRGIPVQIFIRSERRGSGKNSSTVHFTTIEAEFSQPAWQGASISPKGFGTKILQFFGAAKSAVETGTDFDSQFVVSGVVDETLTEALKDETVQDQLHGLRNGFQNFRVENGAVRVENQEVVRDANRLIRYLERVVDRVQLLEERVGGGSMAAMGMEDIFPSAGAAESDWQSEYVGHEAGEAIW